MVYYPGDHNFSLPAKKPSVKCEYQSIQGNKRDFRAWFQKQLQRLLFFYGTGERISFGGCGMGVFFDGNLEIHRQKDSGDLSFIGLTHCSNPWICPVCAPRIGALRLSEIEAASRALLLAGYSYLFTTFTARHKKGVSLLNFTKDLKAAMRLFKKSAAFKQLQKRFARAFEITAFEVTDDAPYVPEAARTGWHPHIHSVIFLDRAFLTEKECAEFAQIASKGWKESCAKVGLDASLERGFYMESIQEYARKTGVKRSFDKMSQKEQEKYINRISAYCVKSMGFELTGATRKISKRGRYGQDRCTPWDLAMAAIKGNARARERWLEYAYAMRGAKSGGAGFNFVRFSPGLRKFAGIEEVSDEDALRGKEGKKILSFGIDLPEDAWLPVAKQGRLWHLLTLADQSDENLAIKAVRDACRKAARGVDILTGENIGIGRVNPAWHGCEGCPPVRIGGDLAAIDRYERDQELAILREKEEKRRLEKQERVYKLLADCDYESIYTDIESLFFAREHMRRFGRDPEGSLPLALPWTGDGSNNWLFLPGASMCVVRDYDRKKRRYISSRRVVWQ